MNIISLDDFKKIPSLPILDNDILVVRTNNMAYIPKPKYPVRIKYFVFVYCTAGSSRFSIDTKMYSIKAGEFLLTASDCVMEFFEINQFEGSFMVVSQKYMTSLTTQCASIWKRLASISQEAIHSVTPSEAVLISEYVDKMAKYCLDDTIRFRNEIICHQILSFLHEICSFQSVVNIDTKTLFLDRNQEIYAEFMKLVIHNFKKEHSVNYYAAQMGLTPKYLSVCVKAASNKTPSESIQKFLIQEAMVLLKNTNMTLKEIVAELNFPTATFFCRYFKQHTGFSPNEYRLKSM